MMIARISVRSDHCTNLPGSIINPYPPFIAFLREHRAYAILHRYDPASICLRSGWRSDMRVALITETFLPDVNGVTTTLCRLLEHFQRTGDEALLFAPVGAPASYAGAEIVPLHGIPLPMYPD